MKKPVKSPFIRIQASIYVSLRLQEFIDLTTERELTIIYGHWNRRGYFPKGHYYFAHDNGLTFFTRLKTPTKKIIPDIEAEEFLLYDVGKG